MSDEASNLPSTSSENNGGLHFIKRNGGLVLLRDGYQYTKKRENKTGWSYWRCVKIKECSGSLQLKGGNISNERNHSCVPDEDNNIMLKKLHDLRETVVNSDFTPIPRLYNKFKSQFCNSEMNLVKNIPSFRNLKTKFYEARNREAGVSKIKCKSVDQVEIPVKFRNFRKYLSAVDDVIKCGLASHDIGALNSGTHKMALSNSSFIKGYNRVFTELADPRTNDWFLISSPIPGLTIIGLYLYFTLKWGPRYMTDKKPFQLQKTLVVYNFIQVVVSCWLFYEGLDAGWLRTYSWKCQPVDFSHTPEAMRVARGVYIYFLAKISELLDTVFFVIRKKERQITFLHLYHHTVMPMVSWGATKYYPGGHGTLIGVINSFVHIIMYSYYMLAALGPQYQKFLSWKRHITTMQMLQFCITFLHSSQLLFYDCGYPRWSVVFTLPNSIFFYYLFYDFYYKSYGKPNERNTTKKLDNGKENQKICNGSAINESKVANGIKNGNYNTGGDKKVD